MLVSPSSPFRCVCFSPNAFNLLLILVVTNIQHPAARPLPSNTRMKTAHTKSSGAGRSVGSNQLRRKSLYLETHPQMTFKHLSIILQKLSMILDHAGNLHLNQLNYTILPIPPHPAPYLHPLDDIFGHVPTVVSPTRVTHEVRT